MYHLKLIKALSYSGAVSATRDEPDVFTSNEAIARAAMASGYFALVDSADVPDDCGEDACAVELGATEATEDDDDDAALGQFSGETEETPDFDTLATMTKDELIAYAKAREIDLPKKAKTKGDILAAISVFYGGSYTMIDLQKE